MKFYPAWSSHFPVLIKVMEKANSDVLELGMGPFSTPILHWLCFDKGLKLFSFDNDKEYFDLNSHFKSDNHIVRLIENDNWDSIVYGTHHLSVAFVDHKPAKRRHVDIAKLANLADFVIIHDSEPEGDKWYRYSKIYKLFKYRYDYTKTVPHTTVLSNFIDLSFLE